MDFYTHNIAEVEAVLQTMDFMGSEVGLAWFAEQGDLSHVVLVGDSNLVIAVLQQAYTQQQPLFFIAMQNMWEVTKKLPVPVEYLHVKHVFNMFSDYMGCLAHDLSRDVSV